MDNSLIQTLKLLSEHPYPIKGVVLGENVGIQVNTVEKNLCYLRKEFGHDLIKTITDENEKCVLYELNKNHIPESNNYEKIGSETREALKDLVMLHCACIPQTAKMVPLCEPESESIESLLDRCEKTLSLHQVNNPCKCGSYYRRGKNCNICGVENDDRVEHLPVMKAKKMKRLWHKGMHRYLTQEEIKRGMTGG